MCVGFLPLLRIRSLNALGRHTNSLTRFCAGNNINHVIRCLRHERITAKA